MTDFIKISLHIGLNENVTSIDQFLSDMEFAFEDDLAVDVVGMYIQLEED